MLEAFLYYKYAVWTVLMSAMCSTVCVLMQVAYRFPSMSSHNAFCLFFFIIIFYFIFRDTQGPTEQTWTLLIQKLDQIFTDLWSHMLLIWIFLRVFIERFYAIYLLLLTSFNDS